MARWEFKLPDIGEGITEGEIVGWLVKPGDLVTEDQAMVEVMTDKATVTITAPKAGRVVETRGKIGEIVPVHTVLIVFDLDGAEAQTPAVTTTRRDTNGAASHDDDHGADAAAATGASAVGDLKDALPGLGGAPGGAKTPSPVPAGRSGHAGGYYNEKPLATPATRKLARDLSIDLRRVEPSGPQGRVTRRDLTSFTQSPSPAQPTASASQAGAAAVGAAAVGVTAHAAAARPHPLEERVPFAGLRRRIAQRMALSTRTAAHFTLVEECDVTALKALRGRLAASAEAQGVKLTYLPLIVKATVAALKKHPILNSTLDESTSELVFRKYFHIGIATATEAGLVVPVVRDADRKSILEIGRDIDRLAAEARAGQSRLEDLQGSTFTITSPGVQGGLFATPIINFPEVAILGVHRMKQRPVVKDGRIVIGDVALLSLSFDHRVVDGRVGAAFAYEIIGYLEQPDRLMLEMA
jgi:pyruvate dehydrogenase E2 component (dihydrolipoamide acetyltransferase)